MTVAIRDKIKRLMIKDKNGRQLVVFGGLLLVAGCSIYTPTFKEMIPPGESTYLQQPVTVKIGSVQGGKEETFWTGPTIDAPTFENALLFALSKSNIFLRPTLGERSDYELNVNLLSQYEHPLSILDKTVTLTAQYELIDTESGKSIWMREVTSTYTARLFDALDGGIRLKMAYEGVAQLNIQNLLNQINSFRVPVKKLETSVNSKISPQQYSETVIESPPPSKIDVSKLPSIAILDFSGYGVSVQEALIITNRIGTHFVALGRYQVIERGQIEQILNEQDFQLSGCTTNECAVEIGQLVGAQQILSGSIGKFGTVYTIDIKIIDVETGRVNKTTSYDSDGSINLLLTEGVAAVVKQITRAE